MLLTDLGTLFVFITFVSTAKYVSNHVVTKGNKEGANNVGEKILDLTFARERRVLVIYCRKMWKNGNLSCINSRAMSEI